MLLVVLFSTISVVYVSCTTPDLSARRIDIYKNTLVPASNNGRVVGGTFASRYQFTYQVSLRYASQSQYSHICGGTLIHPQVVLTAAHCKLEKGNYEIAVGMLDRGEMHQDVQYSKVENFIIHSGFTGGVGKYDIGLLLLKTPVTLNHAVSVMPLPTEEECDEIEYRILSGWGLTQSFLPILSPIRLRWASLPQLTFEDCKKSLEDANNNSSGPLDEETMVCTGADEGKWQSACSGDSGGPLAHSNKTSIIGIVSWGIFPCGVSDAPTVYTKVCSYLPWIKEQADGHL